MENLRSLHAQEVTDLERRMQARQEKDAKVGGESPLPARPGGHRPGEVDAHTAGEGCQGRVVQTLLKKLLCLCLLSDCMWQCIVC